MIAKVISNSKTKHKLFFTPCNTYKIGFTELNPSFFQLFYCKNLIFFPNMLFWKSLWPLYAGLGAYMTHSIILTSIFYWKSLYYIRIVYLIKKSLKDYWKNIMVSTIKFVLYAMIPALCHMDYNKYPIKYQKYFSFEMF